ncbi:UPF0561 protein C2orf68 homolog isoform X4 [Ascaphus truei]|uniref:UPF0561 protein C2orf68 homolog isoform X4 n=1 Tax=Ascaphus truei TaxID=8439 RepID=UPI003F5A1FA7
MASCVISAGTRWPGEGSVKETHTQDHYDREVKQAKEKQTKRCTPGAPRPKKPDLQVYHPRQRDPLKSSLRTAHSTGPALNEEDLTSLQSLDTMTPTRAAPAQTLSCLELSSSAWSSRLMEGKSRPLSCMRMMMQSW